MSDTSLADQLRIALARGDDLRDLAHRWGERKLAPADAAGLCDVLEEVEDVRPLIHPRFGPDGTPLASLAILFQQPAGEDAAEVLRSRGLAQLARLFDGAMEWPDAPAHPLLIAAKMFAVYGDPDGCRRIPAAVRRFPDAPLWPVLFGVLFQQDRAAWADVVDDLADPLPVGQAAAAFLDGANALARDRKLAEHPFDAPAGHARLEAHLTDPDRFRPAVSATAALPFVSPPARERLLALAMDHPHPPVQLEAAWAAAYAGSEAGVRVLARLCLDPRTGPPAREYLAEVGRADAVPAGADAPDLRAPAELCRWLAHPSRYGEPPAEADLFDTRELDWPPTSDRRRVWLVRYRYPGRGGADEVGVGMVGSVTSALFGEATPDLSPEDVYGLHCCWELQQSGDPRAPAERSAVAGRKLLGI